MRCSLPSFHAYPRIAVLGVGATLLGLGLVYPVAATPTSQVGPLRVTVSTSPNPAAIEGLTTVNDSAGVFGRGDLSSSGLVTGVYGYVTAPSSIGTEGFSAATSGDGGYGVFGHAANGNGVFGLSDTNAYASIYGKNSSIAGTAMYGIAQGMGVFGVATAGNGVVGVTSAAATGSSSFSGILGVDNTTPSDAAEMNGFVNSGVAGVSSIGYGVSGTGATGVFGQGNATGVLGEGGDFESSVGVFGEATAGVGVYGMTNGGDNAYGVYGFDAAGADAKTAGVFGFSSYGAGVAAIGGVGPAMVAVGVSGPGVLAQASSSDAVSGTSKEASGVAGYGGDSAAPTTKSSMGGTGVTAVSQDVNSTALAIDATYGTPMTVTSGKTPTTIMSLDAAGNLTISGTLTQNAGPASVARDPQGVEHDVYSAHQTRATLEDFGEGQMVAGRAYVQLDPAFASLVDHRSSYLVFITPEGPTANPLYVSEKSLRGFAVREISNRASIAFDYRIVARPQENREQQRVVPYQEESQSAARRSIEVRDALRNRATLARFAGAPARMLPSFAHAGPAHHAMLGKLPRQLQVPAIPIPR